jgi:hypothetical protein
MADRTNSLRLRVISDGTCQGTRVIDALTGRPVEGVTAVTWNLDACDLAAEVRLTISGLDCPVDVQGDAVVALEPSDGGPVRSGWHDDHDGVAVRDRPARRFDAVAWLAKLPDKPFRLTFHSEVAEDISAGGPLDADMPEPLVSKAVMAEAVRLERERQVKKWAPLAEFRSRAPIVPPGVPWPADAEGRAKRPEVMTAEERLNLAIDLTDEYAGHPGMSLCPPLELIGRTMGLGNRPPEILAALGQERSGEEA